MRRRSARRALRGDSRMDYQGLRSKHVVKYLEQREGGGTTGRGNEGSTNRGDEENPALGLQLRA